LSIALNKVGKAATETEVTRPRISEGKLKRAWKKNTGTGDKKDRANYVEKPRV